MARRLYSALIAPLRSVLEGKTGIVISPDADLHFVPFEILRDGETQLLERLEVLRVPSARDLLRLHRTRHGQGQELTLPALFGDPDYLSTEVGTYRAGEPLSEAERLSFGEWVRGLRFPRLPDTRREVEAIRDTLVKASLFLGRQASEEHLFSLRNPSVLHIATHGYVFDGDDAPNPLMRAYIGLAGVRSSILKDRVQGLVPALRLASLHLRGTRLVVLSACKSALGEVQAGEGVAGLNHALFTAGARSVVSGLWPVADRETTALMIDFYRRLVAGLHTGEALRQTKLEMAKSLHPHYWAAFVLNGESVSVSV